MLLVHNRRTSAGEGVGGAEHYTCAVAGLAATLVVFAVLFGPLVAFVGSFDVLTATLLVALVFFWWGVWWQALELAWDRLERRRARG